MKRAFVFALFAASFGFQATATAQTIGQSAGQELIKRAVAAAGGEQAMRGVKSLKLVGEAKWWEPDQSLVTGGPALFLGDTKFSMTWDLATGNVRTVLDRTLPSLGHVQFDEIVTPKYGFVTDEKSSRPMSGIRVAAQARELNRIAPNLLLRMFDNPASTHFEGGVRTSDGVQPGVNFKENGTTFTVIINKKTQLPAIVRTQDDDSVRGTVNFEVRLEDWKPVAGVQMPHQLTYTLGDSPIARVRYSQIEANPTIDPAQFVAPDAIKASLKPPSAAENVPYQWVIRRLASGFFLDSDKVFVPEGGSLKLVELAPNVQHVVGGTHNNLIVNMKDGVVVFDAPINDAQSRWVINAAREKFQKPVKQLVLTHHHSDHTGGVRAYMAEGATVLVPVPDKKYFVKLALAEHVVADDLQNKKLSVDVNEIKDEMTLKDGTTEIRLIRVPNHHADAMLIAHIMPANVVYVTDLYSPGFDKRRTNGLLSFNDTLRRIGIKDATIAGGHGGSGPQSAVEAIADSK